MDCMWKPRLLPECGLTHGGHESAHCTVRVPATFLLPLDLPVKTAGNFLAAQAEILC